MSKHTFSYSNGESKATWDVKDLWRISENLPVTKVKLSILKPLVKDRHNKYTENDKVRSEESDTSYPILLNSNKTRVLDGMHRLYKLIEEDVEFVDCKLIRKMPPPISVSGPPMKISGLDFKWPDTLGTESFSNVPMSFAW